jgi:histidine triad (HIT) family protein
MPGEDGCPFCEIVAGQREQEMVYSDETVAAFLCEPPATWGHALVVPRVHRDDIWDIPGGELASVVGTAQLLAAVARDELGAIGVNMKQNSGAKAGQDVFHFHMHVVPRYTDDTVGPGCVWGEPPWEPPRGGEAQRRRVADTIRRAVAARRAI